MADTYTTTLSDLLGLPAYKLAAGPFSDKQGTVLGSVHGYLVCIGVGKAANGQAAVVVLVRCRPVENSESLHTAVEQSPAVAQALGSSSLSSSQKNQFAWSDGSVQWSDAYSFKKPKPEKVAAVARAICDALQGVASGFDAHCESCNAAGQEITLSNRVPGYYCAACQEKMRYELDTAGREYDTKDSNFAAGLVLGAIAALAGSIAWGAAAYLLHRIFFYGAIVIGYLVGWGVHKGMGKINRAAQVLVAGLTVVSVLFGDAIYITLSVMRQQQVPFSLALLSAVLRNFWAIETSDISSLFSVAFALGGAYYALKSFRRPEFSIRFDPLSQPLHVPAGAQAARAGG